MIVINLTILVQKYFNRIKCFSTKTVVFLDHLSIFKLESNLTLVLSIFVLKQYNV